MRIAIFGGSFDPVHNEHIRVAEKAIQSLALDKLIVMPAQIPPHKNGDTLTDGQLRLQACRLAFAPVKGVEVSDYELEKGGTSYTFETCRYYKKLYPTAQLFWLVGTDMLYNFPTWKNPEDILDNVTLAVCAREEKDGWLEKSQADFQQRFGKRFAVVQYNGAAVSSTKIRVLAGAGLPLSKYVPNALERFIYENKLYYIPYVQQALALQPPKRREHTIGVALAASKKARQLKINEKQVLTAAFMHDCAKYLKLDDTLLDGFVLEKEWGEVPSPVLHQFAGAYVMQTAFGVQDKDVLNAVRYHTSGRENMSALEKLIFLADMLEDGRNFDGVEELRKRFYEEKDMDGVLKDALNRSLQFVKSKGDPVYPLTEKAWKFYQ